MLKGIITLRNVCHETYYDIVYEWEDCICDNLNLQLISISDKVYKSSEKLKYRIISKLKRNMKIPLHKFSINRDYYLAFIMNISHFKYYSEYNIIPIFLDTWKCDTQFLFNNFRKLNKIKYYVTNYQMFCLLTGKGAKNVEYIPLSIADKWILSDCPRKQIDVIQMGRKNSILHEYMLRFCSEFPDTEYVYLDLIGRQKGYLSTTRGFIGDCKTRISMMELLRTAKVSLVSSPGIDAKEGDKSYGIDFPTPRFYESAVNYCYMIGRYSPKIEFDNLDIPSVCPNVDSYDEFKKCMIRYLESDSFNKKVFDNFIKRNTTIARLGQIEKLM
ncbi:hypothetical protein ACJDU8_03515 [Clostridium sp. WILCCON 0269]|uniref:Glycosyltransferase n=1 Tax=Candidatus Clostridium eludens TaxID=3381663 RepID=A0ABW8SGG6_9CLOT